MMPFSAQLKSDEMCQCAQIPEMAHDLAQSLLVIHAYVSGCIERIEDNSLDTSQLRHTLGTINQHIETMGNKIHSMVN